MVIPATLWEELMAELHGGHTSGHLGNRKTLAKLRDRYFWAGMSAHVRSFLRNCERCAKRKSPGKRRKPPLQQLPVGARMERVALDIVGPLTETNDGNRWILVIGDYFTKWVEAYPLIDTCASTVARKFVEECVCRLGVPLELHSDQGRNF